MPLWFLSKATREHVTVVLSGEGADELFGGYLTYRADRIATWLRLIPAPLRRLMVGSAWTVADLERQNQPGIQSQAINAGIAAHGR